MIKRKTKTLLWISLIFVFMLFYVNHNNNKTNIIQQQNDKQQQNVEEEEDESYQQKEEFKDIEYVDNEDNDNTRRRLFIKQMMSHAWNGYKKYAWGKNEVRPVSKSANSNSVFGIASMGATIVDALDTLFIMDMMDEVEEGRLWIINNLNFSKVSATLSVFETNIRYVGGLLSMYSFTGDDLYKEKAQAIVDSLLPAFENPTGIPYSHVNPSKKQFALSWSGKQGVLAEFGTLHMEFAYLSDITGQSIYRNKVEKIRDVLMNNLPAVERKGLYPNYFNIATAKWGTKHISMGALGDSFYEYLLKEWIRSGKKDQQAKDMFKESADAFDEFLVKRSAKGGYTYFAQMKNTRLIHSMDHLACFAGGMYGLASKEYTEDENSKRWLQIGEEITRTCHESYNRTPTNIGPEAFEFTQVEDFPNKGGYYILRPETVESYFYMWRLTKDKKYRDWGWEAALAIEKHCKAEAGYSGIRNVYSIPVVQDDVQQSFFLAETLKYLYLLFSDDDVIPLSEWVFNTEAHPLPIRGVNSLYRSSSNIRNNNKL